MVNKNVVKVQHSFNLDDPYVWVVKNVEAYLAHHTDNFQNYLYDNRHPVATP